MRNNIKKIWSLPLGQVMALVGGKNLLSEGFWKDLEGARTTEFAACTWFQSKVIH